MALLAASLLATSLLAAACSGGDDPQEGATTTTAPVERSTSEEAPLEVGECGVVPDLRIGDVLDPATLEPVACDQPHDVEVVAVLAYPLDASAPFPGAEAVDGYATDECIARFEGYVGSSYLESSLDVIIVAPGEDGWNDGDRRIACVAYDVDFADLVGSVAGTGR
jgi:hypothetical protein